MHLSRLFQRSVAMYPERPALARGLETPVTYAGLDTRVRALAHWLRTDLGLNPGDRVTLAMKNCTEYAEALLAIWHAGLCAVPVNAKLHLREIGFVLENSGSRACLSFGEMHATLGEIVAASPDLRLVDVQGDAWRRAVVGAAPADAGAPGTAEDVAWLFYTSGTTGRPKGVMLTHANLVAMALCFHADVQNVDETDVLVHVAPMSHGSGLYIVPYLMRGAAQVVAPSGGLDEAELFGLLGKLRSASLFVAPTIVTRLMQHVRDSGAPDASELAPGLRCLLTGGAPFYVEDIKAAVTCFGPRIAQMYGQGETPMTITALRAERIAAAVAAGDEALLASVGFAQTAVAVAILDVDGQPVPAGTTGEVVVRAPTVMRGYWNNPTATAQTLPDGALRTGDVGLLDERGLLHLKDRSKDVIISGGTNIYPREVEEALLRHAAVDEVSVIGTPDPEWGESVTAVVVRRRGQDVDAAALDRVCLDNIARFKRPKHYVFLDDLPKNATGKILKTELRQVVAALAARADG